MGSSSDTPLRHDQGRKSGAKSAIPTGLSQALALEPMPDAELALQRAHGNQAISRRFAGQPHPNHSQPAPNPHLSMGAQRSFDHIIQRKFVGDLEKRDVDWVIAQFTPVNMKMPARWKFEQLVQSPTVKYANLQDVADALNLIMPAATATIPTQTAQVNATPQAIPSVKNITSPSQTKPTTGATPLPEKRKLPTPVVKPEVKQPTVPVKPTVPVGKEKAEATPTQATPKEATPKIQEPKATINPEETEETGTLQVLDALNLNPPVTKKPVFKMAPQFIRIAVNGQEFRVTAGQDYLSTELSQIYKDDPEQIRGGDVSLKVPTLPRSGENPPDLRVVADGHHRFVWGAFHKMSVPVRVLSQLAVPVQWNAMNYSMDKKYNMPPIGDVNAIQEKFYLEWITSEKLFQAMQREAKAKGANAIPAYVKLLCDYHSLMWDEPNGRRLEAYIRQRDNDNPIREYDAAVDALVATSVNKKLAADYGKTIKQLAFRGPKPQIIRGDTETSGHFNTVLNVITLDPVRLPTSDQMLDTLSFEAINAARRAELTVAKQKGGGQHTADAEYETDKRYVMEALMSAHNVQGKSLDGLAGALNLPHQYLQTKADYKECKIKGEVTIPPKSELPEKSRRQTLWWWKTSQWTDQQRKEIWTATPHAEGGKTTAEMYK